MMKTQRASSKVLKNLLLILSVAMIAVSCGGDNTSGKSGNNGIGVNGYGAYGSNGGVTPEQALQVIGNERRCLEGGQRIRIQAQNFNKNVNANAIHFGVSTFGDIAIARNIQGTSILEIYACPRSGQPAQQAQALTQFVLESSQICPVSQITYGYAKLQIGGYGFDVGFAPIHVQGTDRRSQLCTNYNGQY
jgi:hypothetical protein